MKISEIQSKLLQQEYILLSLGSSVGEGEKILKDAEIFLQKNGIRIIKKSTNHKTKPWGGVAQNDFTNATWFIQMFSTKFAQRPYKKALQLLKIIHECEALAGRDRSKQKRWGDRPLDIDILWFPGLSCDTKRLKLPHPYMFERDFVLDPLKEIL